MKSNSSKDKMFVSDNLIVMVLKLHKPFVNIRIGFLQVQDANGCDWSERSEILELPVGFNKYFTLHTVKTKLRTVL